MNKDDFEPLDQIQSPDALKNHVLNLASKNTASPVKKAFGWTKPSFSLGLAYCLGIFSFYLFSLGDNYNHRIISKEEISLASLKMTSRSGPNDQSVSVDLEKLSKMQLIAISKALADKEEWSELEKLTIYIQQKNQKEAVR